MKTIFPGLALANAALLFFAAWVMMPGVGVTDAQQIFALVGTHRPWVAYSIVTQLLSAVLFVLALLGVSARAELAGARGVHPAAAMLAAGAIGSAGDAILHLVAYAMTAPSLASAQFISVMTFLQSAGLRLLAPLLICFFAGGAWLALALANAGVVSRRNSQLHAIALGVALGFGWLAHAGVVPARLVGLATLGVVSYAHIWLGAALAWHAAAQAPAGTPAAAQSPRPLSGSRLYFFSRS